MVDFLQVNESIEQADEVDEADLNMVCTDINEVDPVSYEYFSRTSSANNLLRLSILLSSVLLLLLLLLLLPRVPVNDLLN